ncbi:unnamed protein product [Tenebrio molitor]|nr:unnamed protein product [Tenebrio molitor]
MYKNVDRSRRKRSNFLRSFYDHVVFTFSIATMHGLIHVVRSRRHIFERQFVFRDRLLWMGLVMGAFGIATQQALEAWRRYETSPVVITIEKDFFNWDVENPSILICLRDKPASSYKILEDFMKEYKITAEIKELDEYVNDLLFKTYYTYSSLEKYANGSKKELVSPDLYVELITRVSGKLETKQQKVKGTLWPKNVDSNYTRILTEFGLCHSFHSKLAYYFEITNFTREVPQTESDYQSITKNYKDEVLTFLQPQVFVKYLVFVTDSHEMIDITSHYHTGEQTTTALLAFNVIDIISDEAIRDLSPKQRNCKFNDDPHDLKHSPVYTYNLCRIECRINLALKYCNCTPHYYKRNADEQICNMAGMYCLSKHPEVVSLIDPKTEKSLCHCLQNCNLQAVTTEVVSSGGWFLTTRLSVEFQSFPKERYRRTLIFTKTDILIQIGGIYGLFLGCSVLSFIEISYFFTLRFIWGVLGNRRIKAEI